MNAGALALGRARKVPMIYQDETTECGLACLAMILGFYGHQTDLLTLRGKFGSGLSGTTLKRLCEVATSLDLDPRPVRCEPEYLDSIPLPAILHWNFDHFVVLTKIHSRGTRRRYEINDPAEGSVAVSSSELSAHFTGVALEVLPSTRFIKRRERSKLSIWQLWSRSPGLGRAIFRIIALSVVIELLSLAAPFYLQIGLDNVIPSHDIDLLDSLALGFGLIAVLSQLTALMRGWASTNLSTELSFGLVSNLFRHLVRLPNDWFQKRSVGDVLTRFNSTQPITDLIGNGIAQGTIDVAMTLITFILMMIYSPLLSGFALGGLVLYAVLRLSYIGILRLRNLSLIRAQAREQAVLIETIRGNMPIRLFGRQVERLQIWQARRSSTANAGISVARLQAVFSAVNGFVITAENIIFVYVAIRLNLSGSFTVGMITAFGSYKQQFLTASLSIVSRYVDYKMLDPSLNRLADIALSEPEAKQIPNDVFPDITTISLENVSFAYAAGEALVLKQISLQIRRGDKVAIIGRSGGGKTSLAKLILCLNKPSSGRILVNGAPVPENRLDAYRRRIGTVMQDDTMFAGSIAENIAFFDPDSNVDRVREASRKACLDDDVMAMPMGYDTLVGDMGSALSGGQRQRVLLARALYREPQVLITDEATAHLDPETEARVTSSLDALGITQIVVAHRARTIAGLTRGFVVERGHVREIPINDGVKTPR